LDSFGSGCCPLEEGFSENVNEPSHFVKDESYVTVLSNYQLLKKDCSVYIVNQKERYWIIDLRLQGLVRVYLTFEVLNAAKMSSVILWVVTPCSLVSGFHPFQKNVSYACLGIHKEH
jgi:hypothetical protein